VDDGKGLDYFIAPKDKINDNDLPASHSFGFIAIVIGASYYTKKLPINKFQALCKAINYPIVLIGAKEEFEEGNDIATVDDIRIYNACGKFSLNESADIVRRSKLVISNDTGLLYIACAFNKKTIAIWGGTSPKLAVEPYYGNEVNSFSMYKNFIVPKLSCQPCSNYGTKTCPKNHFKCMQLQDVEAIAASAMAMCKN
jgi:heptosyltransferase-2